jgi:hypothetical protein
MPHVSGDQSQKIVIDRLIRVFYTYVLIQTSLRSASGKRTLHTNKLKNDKFSNLAG